MTERLIVLRSEAAGSDGAVVAARVGRRRAENLRTRQRGRCATPDRAGCATLELELVDATVTIISPRTGRGIPPHRLAVENPSCPSGLEGTASAELRRTVDGDASDAWIRSELGG